MVAEERASGDAGGQGVQAARGAAQAAPGLPCLSGPMLGWVVGESTPERSLVVFNPKSGLVPEAGWYVVAEGPQGCVLGIVESVRAGNALLPDDARDASEVSSLTRYPALSDAVYRRGTVRWLSLTMPLATGGRVASPTTPVEPGAEVHAAPPSLLSAIFRGGHGRVRLGSLRSNGSVEFTVEVNKLFRHLAILAVTGGGKSNTVCILATRLVSQYNATILVFDVHGELAAAEAGLRKLLGGGVNVVKPKINPSSMSLGEFLTLARLPESATVQERIIRDAWRKAVQEASKAPRADFLKILRDKVEREVKTADSSVKRSAYGALNRVDDVLDIYGGVLDPLFHSRLVDVVKPGHLNIIDLSEVDEQAADAVVSHYLRRILEERKLARRSRGAEGYPVPVIVVVEEAHVLIPKDEETLTKYWASRIAREGRKFGVGLVIVSQRPRKLDPDVLSQANNKVVLRIVEPSDQRYVREASEQLSEDLTSLLPSLNQGEAVVVGSMTVLPAVVRVDKCPVATGGTDIDAVGEWASYSEYRAAREAEEAAEIAGAFEA